LAGTASASSDFSFTGSFAVDDSLQYFEFVPASPNVVIQTWGYGGTGAGSNAAGNIIPAGGFDPILSLFDSTGGVLSPLNVLVETTYPSGACPPTGVTDPVTGLCYDVYLSETTLTPGATYLVVLSQNDNAPNLTTLGDGFSEVGNGNFTGSIFGCPNGQFCDSFANNRTGDWAVDITGATSALELPEPGTALMVFTALGGALLLRRRHKAKGAK
jgi:hypothetical protein